MEGNTESDYLQDMLTEFPDLELIEAASGEEALGMVAAEECYAILSDLTDPKAQVLELAHHLRASSLGQVPKLIAVIPRESTPDHAAAFQAGFRHHLAEHGEGIEDVVARSLAAAESLATERQPEEVPA